jgi:hypothetical protein
MDNLARLLVGVGLGLVVIGGLVFLLGRLGIPLGRLPGDFQIEAGGFNCFFPLASMIILSVVLTVLANLLIRLLR